MLSHIHILSVFRNCFVNFNIKNVFFEVQLHHTFAASQGYQHALRILYNKNTKLQPLNSLSDLLPPT